MNNVREGVSNRTLDDEETTTATGESKPSKKRVTLSFVK